LKQIKDQYNAYIWTITGKQGFYVQLAASDVFLMTYPSIALDRNFLLSKWFLPGGTVVDLGAGCGTDTISFTEKMQPAVIWAVEDSMNPTRNLRLKNNVENWLKVYDLNPDLIQIYLKGAVEFFKTWGNKTIQLLYIDPPWVFNDSKKEATPQQMIDFLWEMAFKPMKEYGVKVSIICIKLRYEWDTVSKILDMANRGIEDQNYHFRKIMQFECKPMKQTFYFNIIKNNQPDDVFLHPDAYFNYIYKGIELPHGYKVLHENPKLYDFEEYKKNFETEVTRKALNLKAKQKGYTTYEEFQTCDKRGRCDDPEFEANRHHTSVVNADVDPQPRDWREHARDREDDDGFETVTRKGKGKSKRS